MNHALATVFSSVVAPLNNTKTPNIYGPIST